MVKQNVKGPVVNCADLCVSFNNNRVLDKINFTANPGELHCIIGPNGGGKSTLVKSILGQIRHEGAITLDWADQKGEIGYVPQSIEVDKTVPLTVENFIALCVQKRPAFLGISKSLAAEITRILDRVNMNAKRKYLFSELSGGERQRVLFAQALIPSPSLLILDEPMNSIDRTGAAIFSEIISELKENGTTVIWVHHDLAQVRDMADHVTCINRSTIFQGKPHDVMDEKHLLQIFTSQPVKEAQ